MHASNILRRRSNETNNINNKQIRLVELLCVMSAARHESFAVLLRD